MTPADVARLAIERWRLSRSQVSAALLALDPVRDVDEVRMLRLVAAMLEKKIRDNGGAS